MCPHTSGSDSVLVDWGLKYAKSYSVFCPVRVGFFDICNDILSDSALLDVIVVSWLHDSEGMDKESVVW
jgi:hypothetical protein